MKRAFHSFAGLCLLLSLCGCPSIFPGSEGKGPDGFLAGGRKPGNGEGLLGIFAGVGAQASCGLVDAVVTCITTVSRKDVLGNIVEVEATDVTDGVTLSWGVPQYVSGPQAVLSCTEGAKGLSQRCVIQDGTASVGGLPSVYQFTLKASSASESSTSPENVSFFAARSFGEVPQLPGFEPLSLLAETPVGRLAGYRENAFDPLATFFGGPGSVCLSPDGKSLYFSTTHFIFTLGQDNKVRLYAGNPNSSNWDNFASPTLIAMKPGAIVWTPDGIVVVDTGVDAADSPRVLLVKPVGEVKLLFKGYVSPVVAQHEGTLYFHTKDRGIKWLRPGQLQLEGGTSTLAEPAVSGLAVLPPYAYVSVSSTNKINKIHLTSGVTSLFAGTGSSGFSGDGGLASQATFNGPTGLVFDRSNRLTIADTGNRRLRRIDSNAIVSTIAGVGPAPSNADPFSFCLAGADLAVAARNSRLCTPESLAFDNTGNLLFTDRQAGLVRALLMSGDVVRVVGTHPLLQDQRSENQPASAATFAPSLGIAFDKADAGGAFLVTEYHFNRVLKVRPGIGTVSTYALSGGVLNKPTTVRALADGSFLVADEQRIWKLAPDGRLEIFLGNPSGSNADGTLARDFLASVPRALAIAPNGDVYFSQVGNAHVISVARLDETRQWRVWRIGGQYGEEGGYAGEMVDAKLARFNNVQGLDVGPDNALYVADTGNHRIRRIDLATNTVMSIAGTGQPGRMSSPTVGRLENDGGPALIAPLNQPTSLRVLSDRRIYFVDFGQRSLRILTPRTSASIGIQYDVSTLVNGDVGSRQRCAGQISEKVDGEAQMRASLSTFCGSTPMALDYQESSCSQRSNGHALVYSQAFEKTDLATVPLVATNLALLNLPCE